MIPSFNRDLLPNPDTPWQLSHVSESRQIPSENEAFSISVVSPDSQEFTLVNTLFQHRSPPNREIGRIYQIANPPLTNLFEANLPILDLEARTRPSLKEETHSELRETYLRKWEEMTRPLSPFNIKKGDRTTTYEHAKLMFSWHGTNKDNLTPIATFGLQTFGRHEYLKQGEAHSKTTDVGFFGAGIYLTDSPEVASDYGNCLVLTLVAMKTPFPIVGDVNCNYPQEPSDVSFFKGQGGYKGYNTHFIPIKKVGEGIYYPCSDIKEAVAYEIVIFDRPQALPLFWIELVVSLIRNPVENPKTVGDLIACLMQYQKKNEDRTFYLLQTHIENMRRLEKTTPLNDAALKVYDWAICFFEGQAPSLCRTVVEKRRSLGRVASATF